MENSLRLAIRDLHLAVETLMVNREFIIVQSYEFAQFCKSSHDRPSVTLRLALGGLMVCKKSLIMQVKRDESKFEGSSNPNTKTCRIPSQPTKSRHDPPHATLSSIKLAINNPITLTSTSKPHKEFE